MNTLITPGSGNISFSSFVLAGSNYLPPLSASARIAYTKDGGLTIVSTASSSERFNVEGSFGNLLTVNDSATGRLFVINDVSGFPLFFITDNGSLSSASVLFASGGNSDQWNSVYSSTQSNSGNYILDGGNTKGANISIGTNDSYSFSIKVNNNNYVAIEQVGSEGRFATSSKANQIGGGTATPAQQGGTGSPYGYAITLGAGTADGYNSIAVANGSATGSGSVAVKNGQASGISSLAIGAQSNTIASGNYSFAIGSGVVARGANSIALGTYAETPYAQSFAWGSIPVNEYALIPAVSSTRTGQFMVSAVGGVYFPGNVGIGTDNNDNALTVTGLISTRSHNTSLDWSAAYTNLVANSANYLSGTDILATVIPYLSTNYITLSTVGIKTLSANYAILSALTVKDYISAGTIYSSGTVGVISDSVSEVGGDSNTLTIAFQNGIFIKNNLNVVGSISSINFGTSNQWYNAYTNLVTNSANYLSGDALATVIPYLSTNYITLSTVGIKALSATKAVLSAVIVQDYLSAGQIYAYEQLKIVGPISGSNITTSFNLASAVGLYSMAVNKSYAFGENSFAEGLDSIASGSVSHAEGNNTKAAGPVSHAEGGSTQALGFYDHAEGYSTIADGGIGMLQGAAHAEGIYTQAIGSHSHAEGNNTIAAGADSHAAGSYSKAAHDKSWIWKGSLNTDLSFTTKTEQFVVSADNGVFIPGKVGIGTDNSINALTIAGTISGNNPTTSFNQGSATGNISFAIGSGKAYGQRSFAQGNGSIASGTNSYAEGSATQASGTSSHAEGTNTRATNTNTHSEGSGTLASGQQSHTEGTSTTASGIASHAEGQSTTASGNRSHAEGTSTVAGPGSNTHSEGSGTIASGNQSHTEGTSTTASNDNSHAEGQLTTASGINSHTEGRNTLASGTQSHAEGLRSEARGGNSHAEGRDTFAIGDGSHSEGNNTKALGINAHVEGSDNLAIGNYSHAAGWYSAAVQNNTYVWNSDPNASTALYQVSSTRTGQFLVSAAGGVYLANKVGIGTDSIDNALTVLGLISTDQHGSSQNWYDAYTNLVTNSGNYLSGVNYVNANFVRISGDTMTGPLSVPVLSAIDIYVDGKYLITSRGGTNLFMGNSGINAFKTSGTSNIAIGLSAGHNITTGTENVFIGSCVGRNITTGGQNVFIGSCMADLDPDTKFSVILGSGLEGLKSSQYSIIIKSAFGTGPVNATRSINLVGRQFNPTVNEYNVIAGFNSGWRSSSICKNVFIGGYAGAGVTTGCNVVAIGFRAIGKPYGGLYDSAGCNNIAIGYCAGMRVGSGNNNVFLGPNAGESITGNNNVFIGNRVDSSSGTLPTVTGTLIVGPGATVRETGQMVLSASNLTICSKGNSNIIIGQNAGNNNFTGTNNIFMGLSAGAFNIGGYSNTFIGSHAGRVEGGGNFFGNNTFVGAFAGCNSSATNQTTIIGARAGTKVSYIDSTAMIGAYAGYNARSIGSSTLIQSRGATNTGSSVFINTSPGSFASSISNVFIGYSSGRGSTVNAYNTFIGGYAGAGITTGNSNVFIGYRSGPNLFISSQGSDNIALGNCSGCNITTGSYNLVLGKCAGTGVTTGGNNIIVGQRANTLVNSASGLLILGSGATARETGQMVLSASNMTVCSRGTADNLNILIGSNVGNNNFTGTHNLIIGLSAGPALTTASQNILLGRWAGRRIQTGGSNIAIGYNTLASNVVGIGNVSIGPFAGALTTGSNNIFLGRLAGTDLTNGLENTFIGYRAGRKSTTTNSNVMIGSSAGYHNTTGTVNLFLGSGAGFCSTTGTNNVFIGNNAGSGGYNATNLEQYNNTGDNNTFIGNYAGYLNSAGKYNMFTGHNAGRTNINGCNNIFSGFNSGAYNYHGQNNVFIGSFAGMCSRSNNNNTFIGHTAGTFLQGSKNVSIGRCSGALIFSVTGALSATESIFIGNEAGTRTHNLSSVLVLGSSAEATQSNQIMIGTSTNPLTGGRFTGGSTLHGNLNITIPYKIVEPQTAPNVGFRFFTSEFGGSYLVDTRTNVVSTFLPTTPRVGQAITFVDPYYTWNSNNFILGYTDQPIEGFLEPLSADVAGYTFTAIYVGGTYGWRVR